MLRRAIAGFLVLTLAMLVSPCGFAASSHKDAHICCAPALHANSMECCHSAAPHPPAAPAPERTTQAALKDATPAALHCTQVPAANCAISLSIQPSKRLPATVLRT